MQTVDIDALLDRHRDRFRKLLEAILLEEMGEDPFRFPLSRFKNLSDDEKAELVRRADRIARERVDRELEARGASWLVLVGGDVVLASRDPQAIPTVEEVLRLGEAQDLVPYLFEAPLIEELPGPVAFRPDQPASQGAGRARFPARVLALADPPEPRSRDGDRGCRVMLAAAGAEHGGTPRWTTPELGRDAPESHRVAVARAAPVHGTIKAGPTAMNDDPHNAFNGGGGARDIDFVP
jgi:hypothetical protein